MHFIDQDSNVKQKNIIKLENRILEKSLFMHGTHVNTKKNGKGFFSMEFFISKQLITMSPMKNLLSDKKKLKLITLLVNRICTWMVPVGTYYVLSKKYFNNVNWYFWISPYFKTHTTLTITKLCTTKQGPEQEPAGWAPRFLLGGDKSKLILFRWKPHKCLGLYIQLQN